MFYAFIQQQNVLKDTIYQACFGVQNTTSTAEDKTRRCPRWAKQKEQILPRKKCAR